MADENSLKKVRATTKSSVTRIHNYVLAYENTNKDLNQLKIRDDRLNSLFEEYNNTQGLLEEINTAHSTDRDEFEDSYFSVKACIKNMIDKFHSKTTVIQAVNPSASSDVTNTKLKLQEIKVPTFDGTYQSWKEFYDMYVSIIHNNTKLTDVEKLYYLKNSLVGEAAQIVSAISLTSANYAVAFNLLVERYDNKEIIANSHLKVLFELPNVIKSNTTTLRSLITISKQHLRSLEALGLPTCHWDAIIIFLLLQKLDTATKHSWQLHKKASDIATLNQFYTFLENQCSATEIALCSDKLDKLDKISDKGKDKPYKFNKYEQNKQNYVHVSTNKYESNNKFNTQCAACNNSSHAIFSCPNFLKQSVSERINTIKSCNLCFNCLKVGHNASHCKGTNCRVCQRSHNTLIHQDVQKQSPGLEPVKQHVSTETLTHYNIENKFSQVLLSTAMINVLDVTGKWQKCRALLDGASQSNIVSSSFADKLNFKLHSLNIDIKGVNSTTTSVKSVVSLKIASLTERFQTNLEFLVLDNITCNLPVEPVNLQSLNIPANIILADPTFFEPHAIDMLLGAEIFFDCLKQEKISLGKSMPVLVNTRFGWTIGGKTPAVLKQPSVHSFFMQTSVTLEDKMTEFWKVENVHTGTQNQTEEERNCEEQFEKSVTTNSEGRYIVSLPVKNEQLSLGNSYQEAVKRFYSLETRLLKNLDLYVQYRQFMQEYISLGHMQEIPTNEIVTSNPTYYIPHHCVMKPSSTTTKLRVVYDASMKSSNGLSLNDNLLVGPTLHEDLFSIVLRFRTHEIAFTADIQKMYRQVLLTEEQRDLQRIVWRDNSSDELKHYRLCTVTYGITPAPYLATKCIHHLAQQQTDKHPHISEILQHDLYVDDLLTGTKHLSDAISMQHKLKQVLSSAGFQLHKWSSNSIEFLNHLNPNEIECNTVIDINDDHIKTLGIYWLPKMDQFKFHVNINPVSNQIYTKRTILSEIASIFDPLGVFAPVIIRAKLFIKYMWAQKINWDEPVSEELYNAWQSYRSQLVHLKDISINRKIIDIPNAVMLQLHGFADSSERAYGGCLYLRASDDLGNVSVNLICAKSRVAPMKPLTLPRLELCAVVLLSQLSYNVRKCLKLNINTTYLWTDSSVVLAWISSSPLRWKTFISNRVGEVQELTSDCTWNHVRSEQNPADLVSRGVDPGNLKNEQLWFTGPEWLFMQHDQWPIQNHDYSNHEDTSELKPSSNIFTTVQPSSIFSKFSNLIKLQRCVAYCKRFIHNCQWKNQTNKKDGYLSTLELQDAMKTLIRLVQAETFAAEINSINNGKHLDHKSKLLTLVPFIDHERLLRVGGRIKDAQVAYSTKHPIILPQKHEFVQMLIEHEHKQLLHAGTQATLASLRQQYWILGARNETKRIIHKCVTCFRYNSSTATQLMGDLPDYRLQPIRPFLNTGLDYGGPFSIKATNLRKSPILKAYIVLFICMSTKAIHLECVTSLSTNDFLNALRRFTSRRGKCARIFSDNATTFKGADNQLKELHQFLVQPDNKANIINNAASEGIQWSFIPPRAPNFGGLWEAGIKSVKHHIKRVIGESILTYEEFNTLLIQIEACVNSRPLIPLHDDPSDLFILTPGHFLIGEPLTQIPEPDLSHLSVNKLNHYQLIQAKLQHFWKKWHREYLTQLQQRYKWNRAMPEVHVGQLVLIKEDNSSPATWPRARIIDVHAGMDGHIRVVTVKSADGVFKRPVSKLCILPMEEDSPKNLLKDQFLQGGRDV